MENISRAVFVIASGILMSLALGLIAYSVYQVFEGIGTPEHAFGSKLLDAVGYVVIAVAVFDVSKYLVEEEVVRSRELRNTSEARRSLTVFMSRLSIAVFLEALVMVFQASKARVSDITYPTLLLLAGVALILGLGAYQRLSVTVEEKVRNEPPPENGQPSREPA